jgi:hypothetical protein
MESPLGGLPDMQTMSYLMELLTQEYTAKNIRMTLPAVITNNDRYESEQSVDVKLLIGTKYRDGDRLDGVNIKNVHVRLPSGNDFDITIPCAVGDKVKLSWCFRDLSTWLDGDGAMSYNEDKQNFKLRDCFAELGFGTRRANQRPSKDNLQIRGRNSLTVITPEGVITTDCKSVTVNCESSTVNASSSIDFNTPIATFSKDVHIKGKLDVDQGVFSPTYSGLSGSGGVMNVDTVNAAINVTINGKSVLGHNHNGMVPPF